MSRYRVTYLTGVEVVVTVTVDDEDALTSAEERAKEVALAAAREALGAAEIENSSGVRILSTGLDGVEADHVQLMED